MGAAWTLASTWNVENIISGVLAPVLAITEMFQ